MRTTGILAAQQPDNVMGGCEALMGGMRGGRER